MTVCITFQAQTPLRDVPLAMTESLYDPVPDEDDVEEREAPTEADVKVPVAAPRKAPPIVTAKEGERIVPCKKRISH